MASLNYWKILRISPNNSIGLRPLAYYIHLFQAGDFSLYVGKRRNIRTEKENESRRNCIDLNNGGNDLETLSISFWHWRKWRLLGLKGKT